MGSQAAQTRDALLLSTAVVLGVFVTPVPVLAIVGLPIAAAGIAGLAYRHRPTSATVSVVVGVAAVVLQHWIDVVYVGPAIMAVVLAVILLPRVDAQWVSAPLIGVLALAGFAREYLIARTMYGTLDEYVTEAMDSMSGADVATEVTQEAIKTLLTLLPTVFFIGGLVSAIAIIVAVAWAAKRSDRILRVPSLATLDLSPHVLWPFIAGMLALAASHGPFAFASPLLATGLNLVICTSAVFALQGVGVVAGMLDRLNVGRPMRIWAWIALVISDMFVPVASLVGLLDFWVNFRRLPRDGATPSSPTTAMSDR
jgi:hypothetical protein